MCIDNETQVSPYDPTKLAIHSILRPEDDLISNCGQNSTKTVSFDDIVHFIDEEDIVTYENFHCGITLYPETPTKIRQINRERNYVSRSCKISKCVPGNDQHNCFFLMSSITLISFWTRTIYGTWLQQFLCHSITLMIDTLCPISTLYQQFTNLEQTNIRCSLRCEGWTVKGRECALALHCFNEITYQTDEWTKQLLRLKSWVISGNPERWMEFRRLWWTIIVFKCRHLFHVSLVWFLLVTCELFVVFSKIYFFCSLWWLCVRSKTSSVTSLWSNTPLGSRSCNLS